MDKDIVIALVVIATGFITGMGAIIYHNLNGKVSKNTEEIGKIKEKHVTKEDFYRYFDKLEVKIDRIYNVMTNSGGHDER